MADLRLTKVAMRREEGYPVGVPAPCYLLCPCGTKVPIENTAAVLACTGCKQRFNPSGWLLGSEVKTRAQWAASRQDLSQFLAVGDLVENCLYDYFLEVLPPRTMRSDLLQIGEPNSHVRGRATWPTLARDNFGRWYYAGNCYAGERIAP